MSAQDEPLELDDAQRDALAGFERDAGVFDELGAAQAEDAARISAWVEHATATAGAAGTATTVAASTGKAWLVGGVIAATLGAGAVGLWAQPGPRDGETDRLATAPSIEAPPIRTEATSPDPIAPVIEPLLAPVIAPTVEPEPTPTPEPAVTARRAAARGREDRPATAPARAAADLLREANAARRDGDKPGALALYRRIGRDFPGSREDSVAAVAIGRLELDLGQPARALAAFDAYLRGHATGNLAEEAAFGRASALRALGRTDAEREALREFVARYPDSVQHGRARARLDALGG